MFVVRIDAYFNTVPFDITTVLLYTYSKRFVVDLFNNSTPIVNETLYTD